jgi:queuine tRNA-ribosyltransferase
VVESTLEHLPADTPRYLMGVGTPEEISGNTRGWGVDMMDCVLPTRAQPSTGCSLPHQGKVSIKQAQYTRTKGPSTLTAVCRVCRRYSRPTRHLYASNELLGQVLNTIHNVTYYLDTMRAVRHAIQLGERARFLSERSGPKL